VKGLLTQLQEQTLRTGCQQNSKKKKKLGNIEYSLRRYLRRSLSVLVKHEDPLLEITVTCPDPLTFSSHDIKTQLRYVSVQGSAVSGLQERNRTVVQHAIRYQVLLAAYYYITQPIGNIVGGTRFTVLDVNCVCNEMNK
jgi:hypothetical protein